MADGCNAYRTIGTPIVPCSITSSTPRAIDRCSPAGPAHPRIRGHGACPSCAQPVPAGGPVLPVVRPRPCTNRLDRGAPRRDGAVRRPRRVHVAGRAPRPRAGQATRRRLLRAARGRHRRRSAARSTRSSATPSSPCSARPSPTRTTPSGPCGRRCGCRRRCARSSPTGTRRPTHAADAHRDQHRRGARRHARRHRLHGDGRRGEHRVAAAGARPARRRCSLGDATLRLCSATISPRAVRRHRAPRPRAGPSGPGSSPGRSRRAACARRGRRARSSVGRPSGPLLDARRGAGPRRAAAGWWPWSARPASARPGWSRSCSSQLRAERRSCSAVPAPRTARATSGGRSPAASPALGSCVDVDADGDVLRRTTVEQLATVFGLDPEKPELRRFAETARPPARPPSSSTASTRPAPRRQAALVAELLRQRRSADDGAVDRRPALGPADGAQAARRRRALAPRPAVPADHGPAARDRAVAAAELDRPLVVRLPLGPLTALEARRWSPVAELEGHGHIADDDTVDRPGRAGRRQPAVPRRTGAGLRRPAVGGGAQRLAPRADRRPARPAAALAAGDRRQRRRARRHRSREGLEHFAHDLGQTFVADDLAALVADGILEVTDGRWRFHSEVVREVAYQTLTKRDPGDAPRRRGGALRSLHQPALRAPRPSHGDGRGADRRARSGRGRARHDPRPTPSWTSPRPPPARSPRAGRRPPTSTPAGPSTSARRPPDERRLLLLRARSELEQRRCPDGRARSPDRRWSWRRGRRRRLGRG